MTVAGFLQWKIKHCAISTWQGSLSREGKKAPMLASRRCGADENTIISLLKTFTSFMRRSQKLKQFSKWNGLHCYRICFGGWKKRHRMLHIGTKMFGSFGESQENWSFYHTVKETWQHASQRLLIVPIRDSSASIILRTDSCMSKTFTDEKGKQKQNGTLDGQSHIHEITPPFSPIPSVHGHSTLQQ